MTHTTEQLEAMLAAATPGPWAMGPDEEGEPAQCITADGFDIATAWGGYNRADADTRLIAAAPEVTAELIAVRRKLEAVHGLVDAAMPFVSPVQNADYARQLRQHDALIAALAAWDAAQ